MRFWGNTRFFAKGATMPRSLLSLALLLCSAVSLGQQPGDSPVKVDLYGDPLPAGAIARMGTARYRHTGWHKRLAFVPGRSELVMFEPGGEARNWTSWPTLWDAESGKKLRAFPAPAGWSCSAIDLAPDGSEMATLAYKMRRPDGDPVDGQIQFWELKTGQPLREPIELKEPRGDSSQQIRLAPDGETILTGTSGGKLRLRDRMSGEEILSYALPLKDIRSIDFSKDGALIAAGGAKGAVLWKWKTGAEPLSLLADERSPRPTLSVGFSPNGELLAAGGNDLQGLRVFSAASGKLLWRAEASAGMYSPEQLAFTPDSRFLALPMGQRAGPIEIRDAIDGKLVRTLDGDGAYLRSVAISDDGALIAASSSDALLNVWKLETGEPLHSRFAGHVSEPSRLEFADGGKTIVSADYEGAIHIWDAATGKEKRRVGHDDERAVVSLAASPDGQWFASAGFDYSVRLWRLDSGDERFRLAGHAEKGAYATNALAFTPDSRRFMSFGADLFLRTWNVPTAMVVSEIAIRPSDLLVTAGEDGRLVEIDGRPADASLISEIFGPAQLTADARLLLLAARGKIYAFDTASGREAAVIKSNEHFSRLCASPDGSMLATEEWRTAEGPDPNGKSRYFRLYDLKTARLLREMAFSEEEHSFPLAFSPDGRRLAASHYGPRRLHISILDVESGDETRTIEAAPAHVWRAAFSPDGLRLTTSHSDTTIVVWDLTKLERRE
jgi:WD40 repeat protein